MKKKKEMPTCDCMYLKRIKDVEHLLAYTTSAVSFLKKVRCLFFYTTKQKSVLELFRAAMQSKPPLRSHCLSVYHKPCQSCTGTFETNQLSSNVAAALLNLSYYSSWSTLRDEKP